MLPDDDLTRPAGTMTRTARPRIAPGERFGSYRVGRFLGGGGMGDVYEGEHLETHRRVALKVLSRTLGTEADRLRFLREGQLAASINHPNSLYVFGTEAIGGTLAIVMEMATGGTLKDVVDHTGPMPSTVAVDLMLQVLNGLEAAAAAGVLHRDVKPSNCFVDGEGGVKIGDFGLSIATAGQEETHLTLPGTLLGTPAFAPPEQIRGEALDARSDLYSTGATLYYLLTARAPFAGDGLVQLVAAVLEREADSPRSLNPDLPEGLAKVVRRCLAKDPAARPDSYQRLRLELLPFSSQAPRPAAPGARVMASFLDGLVAALPLAVWFDFAYPTGRDDVWLARETAQLIASLLYYGVMEGFWGASLGKMVFGIRIAGPGDAPPGIGRALLRTVIVNAGTVFWLLTAATGIIEPGRSGPGGRYSVVMLGALQLFGLLVLFSTARRRNGFAGLHDLATRTRVVTVFDAPARDPMPVPESRIEIAADTRRVGAYAIVGRHQVHDAVGVRLAFDDVLRRRVWIQSQAIGTAATSSARRDLARPARLRWLSGKRTADECWDAYDAPEGRPFAAVSPDQLRWSAVRFWLFDLVREVMPGAGTDCRDLPLDVEHVWVTSSGRAVLLDFRCPGLPPRGTPAIDRRAAHPWTVDEAHAFVRRFAAAALGRDPADRELPLHAHAWLKRLDQGPSASLNTIAAALGETLGKRAVLTRGRRSVHLALSAAVPACFLVAGIVSTAIRGSFTWAGIIAPLTVSLLLMTSAAVWSAALFRGGLMLQALGVAVVTGSGDEASRPRAFLRAVGAWSPCLLFLVAVLSGSPWLGVGALAVMVGGFALAMLEPARGLQDRLAGTSLVPR